MERYGPRTIDQEGRLVLHMDVRKQLGWEAGDTLSLTVIDTIVIAQRVTGGVNTVTGQINELGAVALPSEIMQQMGWKENDKIDLYHSDNIVVLKTAA